MHFDRIDEICAMVKSNLQFDKLILTSLTGLHDRFDRSAQIIQQTSCVPIFGVNNRQPRRLRKGNHLGKRIN